MVIKLITIDLDDTLWPAKPVLLRADGVFYQQLEQHAPRLTEKLSPQQLRQQRLEQLQQQPELQHQISRWRIESLVQALQNCEYSERESRQIADRVFEVFWRARQQVTLFEGVSQALAELAEHFQLISLTNGNAHLEKMPLGLHVTHSLRAEQYGIGKPAPLLFEKALELAGCRAEEAVHIGDHPRDDIDGARSLGIRTIQTQLLEHNRDLHPDADAVLEDWRDAKTLVASLQH